MEMEMRTARPGEALPPLPESCYPPGATPLPAPPEDTTARDGGE